MFLFIPVTSMPQTMHSFESNPSNVPAFLIKLWKLVEDPVCNDLIAWSDSGTSFIIKDQTKFSKELLPQYFKHNNMASFIRQLNMYGFRKVMNYEKSGLRNECDEMEFQHSFFSKGQISLLAHIKRKIPNTKVTEPVMKSNPRDILTDLSSIREKQENMDNMLLKMKQENELLWRELTNMRKKHKAQEHVIQKVIQFLVSIVQRSNQNIGVQRKIPRMLHDSPGNKGKSQVACTIDVVRNKNPNIIAVSGDKLVSPLGPVIHDVTDLEHEQEENLLSPSVKSPEDKSEDNSTPLESEYPLISILNSPINTSATMEPLSILEPLQPNTPALNPDEGLEDESVLGIPLEYIAASPINVISIPDSEPCDNIISLPVTSCDDGDSYNLSSNPGMLVCTSSSKSEFDDSLLSESLQTPKISTIHLDDLYLAHEKNDKENPTAQEEHCDLDIQNVKYNSELQKKQQQNDHNYQLALSDGTNVLKSSALTNKEKRCTDLLSNSEMRFHSSLPTLERRNSFANHVISVEDSMNWLSDHILDQVSSGTWNIDDANKLLGLFSTDDVANNETLAGEIADQTSIKTEPVDIVGNELVQFNPSMLDVELNLGNNQFLQCLNQDTEVSSDDISKVCEDQKNFLADVLIKADQAAASEAAEYLLNNGGATKQKSPRRPKFQKLQKAKKRKLK